MSLPARTAEVQERSQDIDAERSVLGAIAYPYDGAFETVGGMLRPEHFYLPDLGKIFEAMQRLDSRSAPLSRISIVDELTRMNTGMAKDYWSNEVRVCIDNCIHDGHMEYNAGLIKGHWRRRLAQRELVEIQRQINDPNRDVDELLADLENKIHELMEDGAEKTMFPLRDRINEALENLESTEQVEITTGLIDLDAQIGGLHRRWVHLFAARPGVGKTALALNIAQFVAQECGVLIISLEMSWEELQYRFLALFAKCSIRSLRSMMQDEQARGIVLEAAQISSERNIIVADGSLLTVPQIAALARSAQRRYGVKLVIIDYVQLIQPTNPKDSREQQVAGISRGVRRMAKDLDIPVVALAQTSRLVDGRANKKPLMSDLRESGQLEADASVIAFIDHPADYDDEAPSSKVVLHVLKNRAGEKGEVEVFWDGPTMTFKNASQASYEAAIGAFHADLPDGDHFR